MIFSNTICKTLKEETKFRRWALHLKNWVNNGNFRRLRCDKKITVWHAHLLTHSFENIEKNVRSMCTTCDIRLQLNLGEKCFLINFVHHLQKTSRCDANQFFRLPRMFFLSKGDIWMFVKVRESKGHLQWICVFWWIFYHKILESDRILNF